MRLVSFVAVLFVTACSTMQSDENSIISYYCDEVVVVGRTKSLGFFDTTEEAAILGRSVFDIEVTIKRVLYGNEPRSVIRAYGVAHAQLREDKDFAFVLTPRDEGYEIRSGYLWIGWLKPRLADNCIQS